MTIASRGRVRRGLVRGTLAAVCLGLALVACEDPTAPSGGLTDESSATGEPQHTHRATVPFEDIDSPPRGGATYTTSASAGHAHSVHLSAANLTDLQQRGAVVSVSSAGGPGDHQHAFTFIR